MFGQRVCRPLAAWCVRALTACVLFVTPAAGASLVIQPSQPTVRAGESIRLEAWDEAGRLAAVTWELESGPGTVGASSGLYQAPESAAGAAAVVLARSTANPDVAARVWIRILEGRISIKPNPAWVRPGGSVQLWALRPDGTTVDAHWEVVGGEASGTVSAGLYRAPRSPSASVVWVFAQSKTDSTNTAYGIVFVGEGEELQVSPAGVVVPLGGTIQFTAMRQSGAQAKATWRVVSGPGSISADGVYRAPDVFSGTPAEVVVEAVSEDPSALGAGRSAVWLAEVSVRMEPAEAEAAGGSTVAFRAQVSGAEDGRVTWSIASGPGTVDQSGVYTAPSRVPEEVSAVVKAISTADPAKHASAVVHLRPVRVEVQPAEAVVHAGNSIRFTASVLHASNPSVQWALAAGPGAVSADGAYTAPETDMPATAKVRAVSRQDPTKWAEAVVSVLPHARVVLTPQEAVVRQGSSVQLRAVVEGSGDQRVTWRMEPLCSGRLSVEGNGSAVYRAHDVVEAPVQVVVTATSTADSTASSSARITVLPPVRVELSAPARLFSGKTAKVTAEVANAIRSRDVTWSVSGGLVALERMGVGEAHITAVNVRNPGHVEVSAVSVEDPAAKATAKVLVLPPMGIACVRPVPDTAMPGDTVEIRVVADGNVLGISEGTAAVQLSPTSRGVSFSAGDATGGGPRPGPAFGTVEYVARVSPDRAVLSVTGLRPVEHGDGDWIVASFPLVVSESAVPGAYYFRLELDLRYPDGEKAPVSIASPEPLVVLPPTPTAKVKDLRAAPGETVLAQILVNRWAGRPNYPTVLVVVEGDAVPRPSVRLSELRPGELFAQGTETLRVSSGIVIMGEAVKDAPGVLAVVPVAVPPDAKPGTQYNLITHVQQSIGNLSYQPVPGVLTVREPVKVSIEPRTAVVRRSGQVPLIAKVENADDPRVVWSLEGGVELGTIERENGLYTAPVQRPSVDCVVVTATSVEDPRASASAEVYFARDVVVQVPSSVRVLVGGSATIEARLENLLPDEENAVVWSLAQGSPGEFTQVGPLAVEYRAPKQIDTPATAKLTARSVADPFATADVVIEIPEVSVSVKAEKATARPGEEVGLSAEVTNGTSGGVQWFVAGPGAVDEARAVYKALQAVTEPTDVRVRAVSVEDPTKSGEAVIRLLPEAVVTAFGPEAPIPVGATAVLKAEVRYVSDTRVRWQLVSGPGQVDEQTGLYTAVAPIRTPAEAVVRAVSVERPNAYADVTVRIARLVVKVVPESQQVRAGESVRFSASVVNCTSGAVRWSVKSGPGTVSNDGLYTAPAELAQPGVAVVRVESVEDPGAYAEAVIGLLPRPTLTVEPASADLRVGEAVRFAVHLQYLGGGVLWSISDGVGSVSEDGVFTAPEALPDGVDRVKVVVRATAAADPSLTAEANVTVRQVRITAMPARYEVNLGESVELKAGVSGALPGMEGVLWRIVRGVGQVDERSGVYTAPAVGRTPAEVVLQAVSADDPRVSAEVEVVIRQVQVQAAPSGVKLRQGESVALTAEVKNCTNRAVRWQVVEGEGTVDTDGRYTAPPKVGQPTQAVVRAVSTADESAYADAVVYIRPPVTVSVVPAEVELSPGESAALRAQVGYADEPSVTWELVSGPGALTEDGVYTAPLEVPEPFTAVVRARSKEDPSAWADAEISVRGSPRLELFPEEAETELGGEVRFEVGTANLPSGAELVWSVVDGPGKIAGGMYKAPDTAVTPTSARVRVSVEGLPALSREALVRIREVNVVASAEPDILNQGDRVHLTAVVTGARNLAVEWSVASGPGRVSADGVYEAPEELAGDTEAFVTATSAADRTKQAVVRLRLMRAWVEVRPKEVSVQLGGTAQFSAVVHGVQVQAVRWSVQGVGSIHDSGLYTAPLTGSTPDEVLVTAESTAKGGLRGTAKVVIPEVKVSVEPKTAEVSAGGETVRLTAVVMGAADTGVTWYLESGPDAGSIDSDGLYRSPANPGYSGVAVLRAVSRADPSKWGAAQVLIRPQPVPVAGNPWPMFLHDARHSGLSSAVGPDDPVVKWKVPLLTSFSSPAVAEDGAMYIGTTDRSLVAVSPLGEVQWSLADTGGGSGWVRSSPAIGPDGTVYVAERAGALAAVSPDGRVRWRVWLSAAAEAGGYSSPAVAEDGTVYAVGTDTLFALSPDGKELWRRELGGFTASSPAVGPDGTVYVGCDDGAVYAIGPDGAVRWRFWTAGGVRSSPVVGDDGTVYFGSSDGNGYAVSADGKERWRIATGAEVVAAAALGPDGRVYLASSDGFLYAVSADGQLLWRFGSGGPLVVAPVVDAKGTVYVAGGDRKLYAVRPDGGVRWVYETDGLLNSSPVIAGPGLMYLPSGDGYVHVLGTRGDTDGDGRVTVVDAVVALRIALGIQAARRGQVELADVSPEGSPPGDGRLTVQDATVILRRAVGIR